MNEGLDLFRLSAAMATHAGRRQALTAENIANADTPGFRARMLDSFADLYRDSAGAPTLTATRPRHITAGPMNIGMPEPRFTSTEPSPNGNTVSLEEEMVAAVNNAREHDRALAIYRHGLTVLRSALGR